MIKNKYLLGLILFVSTAIASSTGLSGQVEYFYMTRLENSQLVNIPFRLLDLNVQHQVSDNFNIFGNIGIEYRNRRDTDFMTDSNLEDFLLDIRELYMSMYLGDGEIRIGKQIHSWGSVDENSPIDNLNAYDYYYLLLGGAEKKLGAYSLAYDNYLKFLGDCKFSFVYSPMHNTSRIPINDPDYPIGLPEDSSPTANTTILSDLTPDEYGLNFKWSFDFGDVSLSHLSMYDRNFNLTGINLYTNAGGNVLNAVPFYSYRLTDISNIGTVLLFNDFTLAFDYAYFNSEDQNMAEDLIVPHPTSPTVFVDANDNPAFIEFEYETGIEDDPETLDEDESIAIGNGNINFGEKVKYSQFAFQFEMPFENNFKVNAQYFKHEINKYDYNPLPVSDDINITNLTIDIDSFSLENLFIPGVGTPYAMITSEAILLNFEKGFPDSDLIVDFNAFIDMDRGSGKLLSLEFEHDLGDGFELSYGVTKILGDDSIEDYNFNTMESFSSFRSRITYYF